MASESYQTAPGGHRHSTHWCAPASPSGPGCPPVRRGRLSCVLLLPGERQSWPGCLHQSSGQHRGTPAARWPPSTHRSLGRKLLFWWTRCEDPCGSAKGGPGLWKSEGKRIHPHQTRGLHAPSGHEGGRGWCYWGIFCKGKKGLRQMSAE